MKYEEGEGKIGILHSYSPCPQNLHEFWAQTMPFGEIDLPKLENSEQW